MRIIKSSQHRAVMDFSRFEESFVACMGKVLPREKVETEEDDMDDKGHVNSQAVDRFSLKLVDTDLRCYFKKCR